MNEEIEANLPSAEECMERCRAFATITKTDNAIAMIYLQNCEWNLQTALSAYYGTDNAAQAHAALGDVIDLTADEDGVAHASSSLARDVIDLTGEDDDVSMISNEDKQENDNFVTTDRQHAHLFRVLSWNIDGLSKESLSFRTPEVINLILREKFHVVCLQEVVPESLPVIQEGLANFYDVFYPSSDAGFYFNAICVLNHPGLSLVADSFTVTKLKSEMDRKVLNLDVDLDIPKLLPTNPRACEWRQLPPIRVRIFTSHLESCAPYKEARKAQLSQTWAAMQNSIRQSRFTSSVDTSLAQIPSSAIFCGDLNIRDSEIKELGGLPAGMVDVWEACGARPEACLTWDPHRNPNISLDKSANTRYFKGQRFDRMMLLSRNGREGSIKPMDFELRGIERVPGRSHFPSDHWAILGHFDIHRPTE